MTGVADPATGRRDEDKIGLTCAACHTGQIHYKGVDVRFDGGPAMTDLKKLELSTGLSIAYTLYVPFRFQRFADRVLGPEASKADRDALKQKLGAIGKLPDRLGRTSTTKTIEGKKTWDEQAAEGHRGRVRPPRRPQSHRQPGLFAGSRVERAQAASRRTCMPRTRRSAIPRSGPCRGSSSRNTTPRSSSR